MKSLWQLHLQGPAKLFSRSHQPGFSTLNMSLSHLTVEDRMKKLSGQWWGRSRVKPPGVGPRTGEFQTDPCAPSGIFTNKTVENTGVRQETETWAVLSTSLLQASSPQHVFTWTLHLHHVQNIIMCCNMHCRWLCDPGQCCPSCDGGRCCDSTLQTQVPLHQPAIFFL